jgi:hypothetical protein
MKLIRVGVDLANNVFQVHGVDRSEKAVWRRKLVRADWIKALLAQIEPGSTVKVARLTELPSAIDQALRNREDMPKV